MLSFSYGEYSSVAFCLILDCFSKFQLCTLYFTFEATTSSKSTPPLDFGLSSSGKISLTFFQIILELRTSSIVGLSFITGYNKYSIKSDISKEKCSFGIGAQYLLRDLSLVFISERSCFMFTSLNGYF